MTTQTQTDRVNNETLFSDAYRRMAPEIIALPLERVRTVNLDIPTAVTMALAAIPRIKAFREDIVKELPSFDVARFDKFENYTLGMSHADTLYSTALKPTDEQKAVYDEGLEVRDVMHADVNVLIRRKLIAAMAVKDYVGLVGYKNVATDLQIVAQVLGDNLPAIQGKCATNAAEIEHALKLAARLLRIAGQRGKNSQAEDQAADNRNRAFTLFIESYEDTQRAIQYLRFVHGDAAEIAPTLYAGKAIAKKPSRPEEVAEATTSSVQASAAPVAAADTAKTGTDDTKNGPFMK